MWISRAGRAFVKIPGCYVYRKISLNSVGLTRETACENKLCPGNPKNRGRI